MHCGLLSEHQPPLDSSTEHRFSLILLTVELVGTSGLIESSFTVTRSERLVTWIFCRWWQFQIIHGHALFTVSFTETRHISWSSLSTLKSTANQRRLWRTFSANPIFITHFNLIQIDRWSAKWSFHESFILEKSSNWNVVETLPLGNWALTIIKIWIIMSSITINVCCIQITFEISQNRQFAKYKARYSNAATGSHHGRNCDSYTTKIFLGTNSIL